MNSSSSFDSSSSPRESDRSSRSALEGERDLRCSMKSSSVVKKKKKKISTCSTARK